MTRHGGRGAALALFALPALATAQVGVDELAVGVEVERELDARAQAWHFTLAPGQYARIVVEQPQADVALRVRDAAGAVLADYDGNMASAGPEHVALWSEAGGRYEIEVRGSSRGKPQPGRFTLRLDVRAAKDEDRRLVPALHEAALGATLRLRGSAESRREALVHLQRAVVLFAAVPDPRGQAGALNNQGETLFELGEVEAAREAFRSALPLWQAAGDPLEEAKILNNLGIVQRLTGEVEAAVATHERALALRRSHGDVRGEAQSLRALGVTYAMLDEHQKAAELFEDSLPLRRAAGDVRGEAFTLHSLGAFHFALGDHRQALAYAQQAVVLHRRTGDRWGEGQSLLAAAQAHAALGESEAAARLLDQVLTLRRELGDQLGEGHTRHIMAQQRAAAGGHAAARETFEQALTLLRASGNRRGQSDVLQDMAESAEADGRPAEAADLFRQALELRRALGDPSGEAESLYGLARGQRAAGQLDEARASIEAALAITDVVRGRVARHDLRATFHAARAAEYEFYVDLLMEQSGRGGGAAAVAAAFEASERARARGLRDLLVEARAAVRAGVDPELLAAAERLRGELVAQERVRTALVETRAVNEAQLGKVRAAITARLDEYKALEARLRARHPGYAALTQPATPRIAEIQALLGADTVLLEYALGAKRSWLFVVTAGSVAAFPLPARAEIEAHASRLHQRLSQGHQTAARAAATAAAAELARLALGPVRQRIAGFRLAIVPDGALHYIPFAALPGGDGLPLLSRHEIVQLPSAATLELLRSARGGEAAPRTVAVFADPVLEASDARLGRPVTAAAPAPELTRALDDTGTAFTRLAFTAREAEAIARLAPADGHLLATGFEASRATALSSALADYRIVHFATHGLLDSRQPELSGIVLSMFDRRGQAQDGFLRLHDVYNLSLRADLVVLSACRTALGQELRGEGLVGLTRGFMYAGAPRVVASLWDVRDEATAELMKHFYSGLLRQRSTPAAALRAAQLALQRTPRWSAPYYWAGFTLQGDWR